LFEFNYQQAQCLRIFTNAVEGKDTAIDAIEGKNTAVTVGGKNTTEGKDTAIDAIEGQNTAVIVEGKKYCSNR